MESKQNVNSIDQSTDSERFRSRRGELRDVPDSVFLSPRTREKKVTAFFQRERKNKQMTRRV